MIDLVSHILSIILLLQLLIIILMMMMMQAGPVIDAGGIFNYARETGMISQSA